MANHEHDPLTHEIIRIFYCVYNELGTGFLESVYKEAMRIALEQDGFQVHTEMPVPVSFRGHVIGMYRADIVVNGRVLLELKVAAQLDRSHEKQVLHYLRSTPLEVGLLLNFGPQPQMRRFVLDNERKKIGAHR
jgi:GxxExxY protein